jgi:hypothetical protein
MSLFDVLFVMFSFFVLVFRSLFFVLFHGIDFALNGGFGLQVRMQDPLINRAHSRALYYDRTLKRRRHRRSSSIKTPHASQVKTAVVLDVLRNAGLVSSIIALFAVLPEDPALVGDSEVAGLKHETRDSRDPRTEKEDEKEDEEEDEEADDDEVMLRDQLCKSAHLGGTLLQMLCRLDAECIENTKTVLDDSLDDLLNISLGKKPPPQSIMPQHSHSRPEACSTSVYNGRKTDVVPLFFLSCAHHTEQLKPLERRFHKYLQLVPLPPKLIERFKTIEK